MSDILPVIYPEDVEVIADGISLLQDADFTIDIYYTIIYSKGIQTRLFPHNNTVHIDIALERDVPYDCDIFINIYHSVGLKRECKFRALQGDRSFTVYVTTSNFIAPCRRSHVIML